MTIGLLMVELGLKLKLELTPFGHQLLTKLAVVLKIRGLRHILNYTHISFEVCTMR